MSVYSVTVAFEVTQTKKKTLVSTFGSPKKQIGIEKAVSRLLGRRIDAAPTFRDLYLLAQPKVVDELLVNVALIRTHGANSLLVLTFDLTSEQIELADDLRRSSSKRIQKIAAQLHLEINAEHYVYAVTASSSVSELELESRVQDTWIHFGLSHSNLFISRKIQEELATRIAIERALISRAIDDPSNAFLRWLRTPWVAHQVRNWPVELLIDKQSTQIDFKALRASMNLPKLREEILDRARTWYSGVGSLLTFIGALLALVGLFAN